MADCNCNINDEQLFLNGPGPTIVFLMNFLLFSTLTSHESPHSIN